jgi:hypothetical protein
MIKKLEDSFLGWIIIILPLMIIASDIHQSHVFGLVICSMILLSLSIPNTFLRLFIWYVTGWFLFILINVFIGRYKSPIIDSSLETFFFFIFYSFIFFNVIKSKKSQDFFFNCICMAAILQAFLGLLQFCYLDPIQWILSHFVKVINLLGYNVPVGTLGNTNYFGAFLVMSLPFFMRDSWRKWIPLIIVAIVLSGAKTAMVALVVGASYYFFTTHREPAFPYKNYILAVLIILSLSAIFYKYHNYDSVGERFSAWNSAFVAIVSSWKTTLFGVGPGISWDDKSLLHSEYVSTFFNWGVLGMFLALGYIITVYRGCKILFTAIIIMLVNAITNHPFHTVPTAVLAVMVVALNEKEKMLMKNL